MSDTASMASNSSAGVCANSLGEDCSLARSWFYKPPVFSLADTAAAAVAAVTAKAASSQLLGKKHTPGVWSYFSMDSGVLAESAVVTTTNKALFVERPGSRESTVRLSQCLMLTRLPHVQAHCYWSCHQRLPLCCSPICERGMTSQPTHTHAPRWQTTWRAQLPRS